MEIKEMIEVLKAFEEGKEVEFFNDNRWIVVTNTLFTAFNFDKHNYRIKPQPTREEIIQKWVKDNNIVVGSKVKIVKPSNIAYVWGKEKHLTLGKVCVVKDIEKDAINLIVGEVNGWYYDIESLEPYKEEFVPFTEKDFELFCDKWIMCKNGNSIKFRPIYCDDQLIGFTNFAKTYKECFNDYVFIDGKPFGKLQ